MFALVRDCSVVVYEAMFERGVLAPEKPLDAYWSVPSCLFLMFPRTVGCSCFLSKTRRRLNIDPVVLEKERAKGHAEVREELGMLESMAFG